MNERRRHSLRPHLAVLPQPPLVRVPT
jgi:hypothetical protein